MQQYSFNFDKPQNKHNNIYINSYIAVTKSKTQIGGTVNSSWTATYFPQIGLHNVYHTTIFSIRDSGVNNTYKKRTQKKNPFFNWFFGYLGKMILS